MALSVAFTPSVLDFGTVAPGSAGPDISVFSPEFTSFNGGVQLKQSPTDTQVSAAIVGDSSVFKLRDLITLEAQQVDVDCSELPHGCQGHRPPTTPAPCPYSRLSRQRGEVQVGRDERERPGVDGTAGPESPEARSRSLVRGSLDSQISQGP